VSPDRSIWCARSRQDSQRPTALEMCRWSRTSGSISRTTANLKRPTAVIRISQSKAFRPSRMKIFKFQESRVLASPSLYVLKYYEGRQQWIAMLMAPDLCDVIFKCDVTVSDGVFILVEGNGDNRKWSLPI
jgi:hypothetical protein